MFGKEVNKQRKLASKAVRIQTMRRNIDYDMLLPSFSSFRSFPCLDWESKARKREQKNGHPSSVRLALDIFWYLLVSANFSAEYVLKWCLKCTTKLLSLKKESHHLTGRIPKLTHLRNLMEFLKHWILCSKWFGTLKFRACQWHMSTAPSKISSSGYAFFPWPAYCKSLYTPLKRGPILWPHDFKAVFRPGILEKTLSIMSSLISLLAALKRFV